MKYKLIKKYPYSPEIGTVVVHHNDEDDSYYECEDYILDSSEVENYPEFWQPESEWVIMSKLSNSEIGSLHWLNTILGSVARTGELMQNCPDPSWYRDLGAYGKTIEDNVREVMNYFQDKLK